MLGKLFGPNAACPIDETTRAWLHRRWDWLAGQFGRDRPRTAPVVLPTDEFFPDQYDATIEAAEVLFDRVCGYLGVLAGQVRLDFYAEDSPVQDRRGLVAGTRGVYTNEDGTQTVWLEVKNLNDPLALAATAAHELGHVLLLGDGRLTGDEDDHEPLTDLLTVYLGLGVITANAVVRDKAWTDGGMSYFSISRGGYLSMPTYGYALALFARARGEEKPDWAKRLRPDVLDAFRKSLRYLSRTEETAAVPPAPVAAPETATETAEDEFTCEACGGVIAGDPPTCAECGWALTDNPENEPDVGPTPKEELTVSGFVTDADRMQRLIFVPIFWTLAIAFVVGVTAFAIAVIPLVVRIFFP